MKIWIVILLVSISCPVQGNALEPGISSEIDKLTELIRSSPCRFNRNGTWYSSSEAAEHITKKYRYFLSKDLIKSSEDFIEYAATKSSLSGNYYLVSCLNDETVKCADWLKSELKKIRQMTPQLDSLR